MGTLGAAVSSGAYAMPLEQFDLTDPMLFHRDEHWDYFKRLREEDPVHFSTNGTYGPYWSVTRYQDILKVDNDHKSFSSHNITNLDENIMKGETDDTIAIGGFIAVDPPRHDAQRKIVSPAVAPKNLVRLEQQMRERTRQVLNSVPIGEEFDWVEAVSLELTLLMLAALMNWPMEEKAQLKRWSDVISGQPGDGNVESWEQRDRELEEMGRAFIDLREKRRGEEPAMDLISMLAHSPAAASMSPIQFISDVTLLIVGGNDTTRNSMSGGIAAFDRFPDEWAKLVANPALVDSAVPEIIRWQTPVMYQGRRALTDVELGGKTIRKGDKVAMWYISGNRDASAIAEPDSFIIDRERPRQHLSFGFGVHRCLGNRLAEMQIRVLLEEILQKNWRRIEVVGGPAYAISPMLHGIDSLTVRIHA